MPDNNSGINEAASVGTSAVSHLKLMKSAVHLSKTSAGALAGGPFGAAIGVALQNRKTISKIAVGGIAVLMLPILFLTMLPGLIFGDLTENTGALNSNSIINENIRNANQAIVEVLKESHADILAEINVAIAKLPEGDTVTINDLYEYNISVNAYLLIAQFCASQDDYQHINLNKLKQIIRDNKDGLFTYDVSTETVSVEIPVEGSGEDAGEPATETKTFTRHNYTVEFAGDAYFADHIFHLTDKQKELAENYAKNLTLFFGNSTSGVAMAINLSDEVLSYRADVERIAAKFGMSPYVELILAVMMQESGGRGTDVMQAAEGGFNKKYPHVPNGIKDPLYSIECGIQELQYALDKAGCTGPTDLDRIKLALQGYNFGSAYIDWAMERDGGYTKENAIAYSDMMCSRPNWHYDRYSICDDNGILLGVNKHNNSLVIADIFDSKQYKNSNICILGCSGAGKTFTMQTMALRMRRKGIQVFIIAPLKGHEFYRAARNVGGEFIQISPASKNCINIMEIRRIDNSVNKLLDGPTLDASALAGKIQRLHVFFSLLIPDMTHEEKQLLDEALIRTYARKGITHKNESLIDPAHPDRYKPMPILGDVYDVLMESPDTKRLAHILNRLVHGSASSFNQQTNVDLSNKYTVLDISELTGSSDLLTVGMFVALDYVWDKAKENRTEQKAIFVDEVWQLIGASSNRLAAEFVLEIAKIIRAYSGAGIFATQDLNDFFALDDGKYGKGIINNCKTKIILNMEDEEAQRVQSILHLSETEVMNITHFQRGNGLISTNNNNITVEFKASNLEKELITTDRQELLEIIERQKQQKAG